MSTPPPEEEVEAQTEVEDTELDIENNEAKRQVWLVKIPNEVYEAWQTAKDTDCVASVRFYESYVIVFPFSGGIV